MQDPFGQTLMDSLLAIYDPGYIARKLTAAGQRRWDSAHIRAWSQNKKAQRPNPFEIEQLRQLLPKPVRQNGHVFRFIDLFAGIGGIRRGFDMAGGLCVFTSEWNKYAVRTYKANHYCDPAEHLFNEDIRTVTLSSDDSASDQQAFDNIDQAVPDHDVLLAGFPCQPFSIAGVSKKNALGRSHGFECKTQGTLFFDVARIIQAKRPLAFVLENVKNLKSHDCGRTFSIILETLDELGYDVADVNYPGTNDPKVIDASLFLPQHRERIVLVGFRRDLPNQGDFSLQNIKQYAPAKVPVFGELLEPEEKVDPKYVLSPKLWRYLYDYANKHRAKGNGFGFGMTRRDDVARTLSARYYKDGSEILVDRGWDESIGFDDLINQSNRPRRLTPTECARLMGFDAPGESHFRIPVSDTQAYQQFGNSVAVPVFSAIAEMMRPRILAARQFKAGISELAPAEPLT